MTRLRIAKASEHRWHSSVMSAGFLTTVSLVTVFLVACTSGEPHPSTTKRSRTAISAREAASSLDFEQPLLSIGEVIDATHGFVRGRVTTIHETRWNSPDGRDWQADFEANPEKYDTIPMPMTRVSVLLEEVLFEDSPKDAPPLVNGSTIDVEFRLDPRPPSVPGIDEMLKSPRINSGYLSEGVERVFFLSWAPFPVPNGPATLVWRGNQTFGLWGLVQNPEGVFPASLEHAFSLKTGVALGKIGNEGDSSSSVPASISIDELRRLIALEKASPDNPSVASFDDWPWEKSYDSDLEP